MIVAVDFDGTLSLNAHYPNIGKPNIQLFSWLKEMKENNNDTIILWTCRDGKELDEAVKWCNEQGLYFDYVNENVPYLGFDSRKIVADMYIDDLAYNPHSKHWLDKSKK